MSQHTPDAWIERNEDDLHDPYFSGGEPDFIFTEPCAKCGKPSNPDESNLEDGNWYCTNCIDKLLKSLPCGYSAEYDQGRFNLYRGSELLFVGLGFKELEEKVLGLETPTTGEPITQKGQAARYSENYDRLMSAFRDRVKIIEMQLDDKKRLIKVLLWTLEFVEEPEYFPSEGDRPWWLDKKDSCYSLIRELGSEVHASKTPVDNTNS